MVKIVYVYQLSLRMAIGSGRGFWKIRWQSGQVWATLIWFWVGSGFFNFIPSRVGSGLRKPVGYPDMFVKYTIDFFFFEFYAHSNWVRWGNMRIAKNQIGVQLRWFLSSWVGFFQVRVNPTRLPFLIEMLHSVGSWMWLFGSFATLGNWVTVWHPRDLVVLCLYGTFCSTVIRISHCTFSSTFGFVWLLLSHCSYFTNG